MSSRPEPDHDLHTLAAWASDPLLSPLEAAAVRAARALLVESRAGRLDLAEHAALADLVNLALGRTSQDEAPPTT